MDLDIRRSIYNNLKGEDKVGILNTINDSIISNDELVLPGLGVLFEIVWNNMTSEGKDKIITYIEKEINFK